MENIERRNKSQQKQPPTSNYSAILDARPSMINHGRTGLPVVCADWTLQNVIGFNVEVEKRLASISKQEVLSRSGNDVYLTIYMTIGCTSQHCLSDVDATRGRHPINMDEGVCRSHERKRYLACTRCFFFNFKQNRTTVNSHRRLAK